MTTVTLVQTNRLNQLLTRKFIREFVSITVSEDAKRAALVYDRFGELVVSLVDLEADVVTQ